MAKRKTNSKVKDAPKQKFVTVEMTRTQNALADAFGLNQANLPTGIPSFGSEMISNTNTLFKNLRWYLISNFRQLLSEMYVELGLIQTIIDLPVDDALSGGIVINSQQLDEDQIKELQAAQKRKGDILNIGQAAKWNRLFGGAGVIVMTDQDPSEPLNVEAITIDEPLEFRAVDMWELFFQHVGATDLDPSLQLEQVEHYNYYGEKIHKSRVFKLKGLTAPSFVRPRLRGWGFSVVEKVVRSINQYLKSSDLTFEVLDEFKLDIFKLKNLVSTLESPNGEEKVRRRVALANKQKSYQNALVMDSEDDFDHKQLSFAGLAEAQGGIRKQIASEFRMPLTKLFGASESGGIGNNDQNDLENYNAMVENEVRSKIGEICLQVTEIRCQQLFGFIPDDLEISFPPLRVLTAEQEENVKTQKFTRLSAAKAAGEITTFEFREAINKGRLFDITLDNQGDSLNPDDHEIDDLVSGTKEEELDPKTGKPKEPATLSDEDKPNENKDKTQNELPKKIANPGKVDEALWEKAKRASQEAFGEIRWPFVTSWYKKQGGTFTKKGK